MTVFAAVDTLTTEFIVAAGVAGACLVAVAITVWQLRTTRRRLQSIAGALATAGDGLAALDAELRRQRRDLDRGDERLDRCWKIVQALQFDVAEGAPTPARDAQSDEPPLADSESELVAFIRPSH